MRYLIITVYEPSKINCYQKQPCNKLTDATVSSDEYYTTGLKQQKRKQKLQNTPFIHEGVSKSPRTESIMKHTLTTINTRWEATKRFMAAKLTRLTHKIAIQLHLVAERCTICSSRSRRPVRKLLRYTLVDWLAIFLVFLQLFGLKQQKRIQKLQNLSFI
jgi:hypothetical protein